MNEHINLDDSVLAPKRPLSMEPADTEGHVFQGPDDSEAGAAPSADDSDVQEPSDDDSEGHALKS